MLKFKSFLFLKSIHYQDNILNELQQNIYNSLIINNNTQLQLVSGAYTSAYYRLQVLPHEVIQGA